MAGCYWLTVQLLALEETRSIIHKLNYGAQVSNLNFKDNLFERKS
jgi:hypothetical protein